MPHDINPCTGVWLLTTRMADQPMHVNEVFPAPCSTLDPALRMERRLFPDPRGLALLGSGVLYLLATPGVLAGFIDTYLLAPLQRAVSPVYGPVRVSLTGVSRCCRCGVLMKVRAATQRWLAVAANAGCVMLSAGTTQGLPATSVIVSTAVAWLLMRRKLTLFCSAGRHKAGQEAGPGRLRDGVPRRAP